MVSDKTLSICPLTMPQADQTTQVNRKRTFRTFKFRGYELEKLLEMPMTSLVPLLRARQRRRISRGRFDRDTHICQNL